MYGKRIEQTAGYLENCHECVEAVDIERVYLVKISYDEIQEAAPPGDIPVLLRQDRYFLRRQLEGGVIHTWESGIGINFMD